MRGKFSNILHTFTKLIIIPFISAILATILANAVMTEFAAVPWSEDAFIQWQYESIAVGTKYISVQVASLVISLLIPWAKLSDSSLSLVTCRAVITPMVQIAGFLCMAITNGLIHTFAIADVARLYWAMTTSRFGNLFMGNLIGRSLSRSNNGAGQWLERNLRLQIRACTGTFTSILFGCLFNGCSMIETIKQTIGTRDYFIQKQVKASIVDDFVMFLMNVFGNAL
jgi:hypothetical protein